MNQLSTNSYANDRYAYIIILTARLRFRIASHRFCLHLTKVNRTTVKSFRRIQHNWFFSVKMNFVVQFWKKKWPGEQRDLQRSQGQWWPSGETNRTAGQLSTAKMAKDWIKSWDWILQLVKDKNPVLKKCKCYRRGMHFFSFLLRFNIHYTQHLKVAFQHQCTQQGSGWRTNSPHTDSK